ncbi:acid phosphatase type 7-like [Mytilus galloprovincialis]|uniref:acid phosphatase type 7-like n=1 Tax=Mytilus galloprovincialis TaxID=29158 RepID=UPI003F7C8811
MKNVILFQIFTVLLALVNAWEVENVLVSSIKFKDFKQPEQIHISFGDVPTKMLVTWSTMNVTQNATCLYGVQTTNMIAKGYTRKFVDGGPQQHTQFIHRVTLINLKPGTRYVYSCGNGVLMSEKLTFVSMKDGSDWSPRIALFGDLGFVNPQSVPRLINETKKGMYDAIFHVGDFGYDLDAQNGHIGDEFLNLVQPIAGQVPYMTCPGNHENAYNFSNYKNRFTMPGDEDMDKMFYSFNIGPAHIISISTEYYFYLYYGIMQVPKQYEWLENDLKEAAKPENRAKRPWIITMGHRPMYCSNNDNDDCTHHESLIRVGVPYLHFFGLEKLFHQYGVDVMVWAHEHSYERLWPVYDRKVMNGSRDEPYTNPKAPVHFVTGSAGCQERHDPFKNQTIPEWSAVRSLDYGYSRMQIMNSSHLYWEQVSDDKDGAVIDKVMIIKDKHGPYE